jgi:hypothetical protein
VHDVAVADDVGVLERPLPGGGVEGLRDADVARRGADAGGVQRGAELRGAAADEAGVLDAGVADAAQLGQAAVEVDIELVAQGVQLHADLLARHALRPAVLRVGPGGVGRGGGCGAERRAGGQGGGPGGGAEDPAAGQRCDGGVLHGGIASQALRHSNVSMTRPTLPNRSTRRNFCRMGQKFGHRKYIRICISFC